MGDATESGNSRDQLISEEVCQKMQTRYENGYSIADIAGEFGRSPSGVRYHVTGQCVHDPAQSRGKTPATQTQSEKECPFCRKDVPQFATHLPCEESP